MSLGERVRAIRQARNMTIATLADTSGLTKGFISQMERGRANPSLDSLHRIAASLGVSSPSLLSDGERALQPPVEEDKMPTQPEVFRHADWDGNESSLVPALVGRTMSFASSHLAPGAVLQAPAAETNEGVQSLCVVLAGDAAFTQGSTEVVLFTGDIIAWNSSHPYSFENRGPSVAALLIIVEKDATFPAVRQQTPNYYSSVSHASSQVLENSGPLRLVALREQSRNRKEH